MTAQDFERATRTRAACCDYDAEFKTGLVELIPYLRRYAKSLSRSNMDLADDFAQGALAKAWEARESFASGSNLKAWLFTILRNQFFSECRKGWRNTPLEELTNETPEPPDKGNWAVELSDAARAMSCLPNSQREALLMVGVGGFSYDDAASVAKVAVGTMKSRVAHGRRALKSLLDSKKPLSGASRPAIGNAMNEILAQFTHLSQNGIVPQHHAH